eukprot:1175972-Prorocentrum_minimum.AAC.2
MPFDPFRAFLHACTDFCDAQRFRDMQYSVGHCNSSYTHVYTVPYSLKGLPGAHNLVLLLALGGGAWRSHRGSGVGRKGIARRSQRDCGIPSIPGIPGISDSPLTPLRPPYLSGSEAYGRLDLIDKSPPTPLRPPSDPHTP